MSSTDRRVFSYPSPSVRQYGRWFWLFIPAVLFPLTMVLVLAVAISQPEERLHLTVVAVAFVAWGCFVAWTVAAVRPWERVPLCFEVSADGSCLHFHTANGKDHTRPLGEVTRVERFASWPPRLFPDAMPLIQVVGVHFTPRAGQLPLVYFTPGLRGYSRLLELLGGPPPPVPDGIRCRTSPALWAGHYVAMALVVTGAVAVTAATPLVFVVPLGVAVFLVLASRRLVMDLAWVDGAFQARLLFPPIIVRFGLEEMSECH